jgi:hypothetical protein
MTLEELDESLPNGLHDARIKALTHDYESATVKLRVEILFGSPSDPRRKYIVTATVRFCFIRLFFVPLRRQKMRGLSGTREAFGSSSQERSREFYRRKSQLLFPQIHFATHFIFLNGCPESTLPLPT